MANILERTKLILENEITLNIPSSEFEKAIKSNLDPSGFRFFEVFSKSKNSYKGSIDSHCFTIQKKRRLFQLRSGLIKITGQYKEENTKTIVSYEVHGWNMHMTFLYIIFIVFYVFGFSLIFQGKNNSECHAGIYFSIALSLHMVLQISAPIIAKKRSVKRTSDNLINEFQEMITHYKYNSKFELT